jgi:hypothetical protein
LAGCRRKSSPEKKRILTNTLGPECGFQDFVSGKLRRIIASKYRTSLCWCTGDGRALHCPALHCTAMEEPGAGTGCRTSWISADCPIPEESYLPCSTNSPLPRPAHRNGHTNNPEEGRGPEHKSRKISGCKEVGVGTLHCTISALEKHCLSFVRPELPT